MATRTFNWRAARRIAERTKAGVTDLAEKTGYSQPHLSNVLGGKRPPSWEMVEKIALALGCDVLDLLGDADIDS